MLYLVDHVEEELYEWSMLEYVHMLQFINLHNSDTVDQFVVTNASDSDTERARVLTRQGARITNLSALKFLTENSRAQNRRLRVVLLDQLAEKELGPDDHVDAIIVGGILGTDEFDGPIVDRTEHVRNQFSDSDEVEFVVRHLGRVQMTADTALITSYLILKHGFCMSELKFVDRPSVRIARNEFTEMPFRYLLDYATSYVIETEPKQVKLKMMFDAVNELKESRPVRVQRGPVPLIPGGMIQLWRNQDLI